MPVHNPLRANYESIAQTDHVDSMNNNFNGVCNGADPNWKKFATYSANSLRSLSNGLMIDQNGTFYQKETVSTNGCAVSSTPTKYQTTPTKCRPGINMDADEATCFSRDDMFSPNKPREALEHRKSVDEMGSLLKTINKEIGFENQTGEMKISGAALLAKQQMLKQELNAKLNEANKLRNQNSNGYSEDKKLVFCF